MRQTISWLAQKLLCVLLSLQGCQATSLEKACFPKIAKECYLQFGFPIYKDVGQFLFGFYWYEHFSIMAYIFLYLLGKVSSSEHKFSSLSTAIASVYNR